MSAFCAVSASAEVSVAKTIAGPEPYPANDTVHTIINITNTEPENITNIYVLDKHDPNSLKHSSASPDADIVNNIQGTIEWFISTTLEENESYTIDLYLTPKAQGVTYNNVTANVTFLNGTNESDDDSIWFAIGDYHEYDNIYQNASAIPTDGTEQFHTFYNTSAGAQDIDWVKFSAEAGYYYIIQTKNYSHIGLTDTVVSLFDTDGTTKLQENDDIQSGVVRASKIVWQADTTGTFYVKVTNWNTSTNGGNYSISIEKQGKLKLYIDEPSADMNVTRHSWFNVTGRLECDGGPCKDVSFTLDPKQDISKNQNKKEIDEILGREGRVNVIIKLKDEPAAGGFGIASAEGVSGRKMMIKQKQDKFLSSAKKFSLKRRYSTVLNGVAGSVDAEGLQELLENENVEAVYYDRPVQAFLSVSVPFINGTRVWPNIVNGQNITGTGQSVCVIDTGIRYGHPDFGSCASVGPSCPKVPGGYDFVNGDNDPYDDHTTGHGTHVSGIVASINNTYRGIAPGANIVSIKALNSAGSGSSSDIIAGIGWCVGNKSNYNISVISMSLGDETFGTNLPCDYDVMASAVNSAVAAGITVVVASGNENRGYSTLPGISTPACISNAVSVGAVGRNDNTIATYTNRDWFLDILAPGSTITATKYSGGHFAKSGTSMATPHIAGVAALIQQKSMIEYGRLTTPQDIRDRIRLSDITSTDSGYTEFTFPRVDAYDAVMQKGVIPTIVGALPFYTNVTNPYDCGNLSDGGSCNVTWWVNATGTGPYWEFFLIGESDVEFNSSESVYISIQQQASCSLIITPQNQTVYNTSVNATCSCTNSEAFAVLHRNSTDVTSSENMKNAIIPAGEWNYTCSVAETQNFTSASTSQDYVVNKANTTISLAASPNWTVDYGIQTNVSCSSSHSQENITLKRNGNNVANPDVQTLAAGNYNYTCIVNESQNYTGTGDSAILDVSDITPPNWTSNKTSPASGTVYSPGTSYQFNVTWNDDVGIHTVRIEHNFTGTLSSYDITTNSSDEYYYDYTDIAAGSYVWRMYANDTAGNQNQTGQWQFVVSRASSEVNLLIDGTDDNTTAERAAAVNITAQLVAGQSVLQVLENGTLIGSNTTNFSILKQYSSIGGYNITLYHPATQNYTSSFETHILTVEDTTPPAITITSPANESTSQKSHNIEINITTDEAAACIYRVNSGNWTSLGSGTSFSTTFSIYENTGHTVSANCTDSYSNSRVSTNSFTVNDSTAPNITSKSPTGSTTDTTPDLSVSTDEPAICAYSAQSNLSFENMTLFSTTNATTSVSTLSLSTGSYTYYVKCRDRLNNTMADEENISFTIASPPPSGGGGGSSGCSDECESGETGCTGPYSRAVCQYNLQLGCWKWAEVPCADNEECDAGVCIEKPCIEEWICGEWSGCINGTRARVCEDWQQCGTELFKPMTEEECEQVIAEAEPEIEEETPEEYEVVDITGNQIGAFEEIAPEGNGVKARIREVRKGVEEGKFTLKKVKVNIETIEHSDVVSKVTLKFSAEMENENIEVIHIIPKEVAESAYMIRFNEPEPEILLADPVVRWEFKLKSQGDAKELVYFVDNKINAEQVKTLAVSSPALDIIEILYKANHLVGDNLWYVLAGIAVLALVIGIASRARRKKHGEKSESDKEKKKKKRRRGSLLRRLFKRKTLDDIGDDIEKIERDIKKI